MLHETSDPKWSQEAPYCDRVMLSRVITKEGLGVEGDPVRRVTYWYDDDGMLLWREDPLDKSGEIHAAE